MKLGKIALSAALTFSLITQKQNQVDPQYFLSFNYNQ